MELSLKIMLSENRQGGNEGPGENYIILIAPIFSL